MGEQKDRLVSVHDVLGFLPDFDSLSDPPEFLKTIVIRSCITTRLTFYFRSRKVDSHNLLDNISVILYPPGCRDIAVAIR